MVHLFDSRFRKVSQTSRHLLVVFGIFKACHSKPLSLVVATSAAVELCQLLHDSFSIWHGCSIFNQAISWKESNASSFFWITILRSAPASGRVIYVAWLVWSDAVRNQRKFWLRYFVRFCDTCTAVQKWPSSARPCSADEPFASFCFF